MGARVTAFERTRTEWQRNGNVMVTVTEQKRVYEEELEMKRNEIYRNLFLNRESGSFLNDFHTSRF